MQERGKFLTKGLGLVLGVSGWGWIGYIGKGG